jgi:hypothetical protein
MVLAKPILLLLLIYKLKAMLIELSFVENMKFACQRSGNCCSHSKIMITLTHEDLLMLLQAVQSPEKLESVISFLKFEENLDQDIKNAVKEQLIINGIKTTEGELIPILKKKKENSECIFYDRNTHNCQIYPYRPLACRMFPLGFTNIAGRKAITWNSMGLNICPGINKGQEIEKEEMKNLIIVAERAISTTNKIIESINAEALEKQNLLSSKEAVLMLLYVAIQTREKSSRVHEI